MVAWAAQSYVTQQLGTGGAPVESDKASMEILSSHAGVVREWKVKVGDAVGNTGPILAATAKTCRISP